MPTEVVPYYRGVIERGSFVYLDSYETARKNRNIRTMQEEERKMKEQEEEMHKNMNPPKSSRKMISGELLNLHSLAYHYFLL